MAKAPVKKILTEEDIEEQTPKIVGGAKKRDELKGAQRTESNELDVQGEAPAPKPVTVIKRKQFELGDSDITFLNQNQFSEEAWEAIGRRHGVDHTTRESLGSQYKGRGFLAIPKKWEPLPSPVGGVLTSNGFQAATDGFINTKPISAKSNMSGVQAELRGRKTLTTPITDTETEETV